jgi:hypothetical protein
MKPMGFDACQFGPHAGIVPTRGPQAEAPLAKPAAPVALQQSRILRTTLNAPLRHTIDQLIQAATPAQKQKSAFAQSLSGFAQAPTEIVNYCSASGSL